MTDYIDEHMNTAIAHHDMAMELMESDTAGHQSLASSIDFLSYSLADMVIRYREENYLSGEISREQFDEVQEQLKPVMGGEVILKGLLQQNPQDQTLKAIERMVGND